MLSSGRQVGWYLAISDRLRMIPSAGQQINQQADSPILYLSGQQLLTITLNRPKALNALNIDMIRSLDNYFSTIKEQQVVWLQGAGKAFCAGGDLKAYYAEGVTEQDRINLCRQQIQLYAKIHQLKALQIACWDGVTMGSGVGMSIFGSVSIATEKTVFAMPEAKIGLFCDAGATYALSRLRNNIGYYLGLTSNFLRGEDVYIAGLAQYFIPSQKLEEAQKELEEIFVKKVNNPKEVVATILSKYNSPSGKDEIDNEMKIKELFSLGSGKQILEKALTYEDEFHRKVAKMMMEVCPVSVELIYKVLKATRTMGVKETLNRDFMLLENMINGPDFKEGVRYLLLQKGTTPKWSVPDLAAVKDEQVERLLTLKEGSKPLLL